MPPASDRTPLLSPDGDTVGTDPRVDDTRADLRRVADSFPRSVWLIATVEFCERFSFFRNRWFDAEFPTKQTR